MILQSNMKIKEAIFIPDDFTDFTRDRGRERVVRHCEGEIEDHHHVRPSPTFNPASCHHVRRSRTQRLYQAFEFLLGTKQRRRWRQSGKRRFDPKDRREGAVDARHQVGSRLRRPLVPFTREKKEETPLLNNGQTSH